MNKIKKDSKFTLDANNIFELSIVDNPASQGQGFFFSAQEQPEKQDKLEFNAMNIDSTKHTVSGIFFPADKEVERYDDNGTRYWVSMTKEAVFSMLETYVRQGGSYVTIEHGDSEYRSFSIVESWIIKNESTESPLYGHTLQDLGLDLTIAPIGTAMISIYINDTEFWEKYILNGKCSFSIGGYFKLTPVEEASNTMENFNEALRNDFHKRIVESNEYKYRHSFGAVYKYLDDNDKTIEGIIKHEFNGKTYDLDINSGWILGFTESEIKPEIEIEPEMEDESNIEPIEVETKDEMEDEVIEVEEVFNINEQVEQHKADLINLMNQQQPPQKPQKQSPNGERQMRVF